jgi:uncharacterized protein (TIGR03086 family)
MDDPRELSRRAGALAEQLIAGVRRDQLAAPTPCREWDVAALINHMAGGNLRFVAMVTGEPGPDRGPDVTGADPLAAFRGSMARLNEAFSREGFLGQTYPSPFGEVPGAALAAMRATELTVHCWDLAAATGQSRDLDPGLVAFAEQSVRSRPLPRGEDAAFGPEQPAPEGAGPADRLAAFLGRTVPG